MGFKRFLRPFAALLVGSAILGTALADFTQFKNNFIVRINNDGTVTQVNLDAVPRPMGPPGSAKGAIQMPPTTNFFINAAGLMKPYFGFSTMRVSSTTELPVDGGGDFRISCPTSHMLFDDPIVYPGQPGKSHLHTFFGNSDVNGLLNSTTLGNLPNFGRSSCNGGTVNRSGYWIPSVIDTTTGMPVAPTDNLVYYKNSFWATLSAENAAKTTAPVPGLRMITGDPTNTDPSVPGNYARWDCNHSDGKTVTWNYSMPGADCEAGSEIILLLHFPNCWDGIHLDTPNHASHMAFEDPYVGCPSTHPVLIPHISFNIHFRVTETSQPKNWRLASDRYALDKPAGLSIHGDWINGWQQDILQAIVNGCLHPRKDCHAHLLGDGRAIY